MRIASYKWFGAAFCIALQVAAAGAEPRVTPPAGGPRTGAGAPPPPPAAFYPAPSELVYVPVKPCRAFDTRAYTPIAAGGERTFWISGDGLDAQGGSAAGCGVPIYATAVQLTLSTVGATSAGNALAYALGTTRPTIAGTAYAGAGLATGNSVTALGLNAGRKQIRVYSQRQTNVIGDVTGFYAPQIQGLVDSSGGIYSGSPSLISAVRNSTGNYTLTVDRDVSFCTPNVRAYSYGYEAHVFLFNSTTISLYVYSRDPAITPRDDLVYISVAC